ncbi:hypothetical protein [Aliiroseovarius subalbicans]|uniref:hypothetical protein n=1 Tax=Aliiroseovarius subalbicans TaxID=2925840 RepID=UPI001F55D74D|nr:hypothetical protein [Aliiroseovarius subalbicans]MCI2400660.1 hypothetical protein [Aliiroseovarius subalbicans]
MKQQILALGLGVGAILLTAGHLQAQNQNCADRARVIDRLANSYGETRQSIGLAANNQMVEVFASTETGSWTITVTLPSGLTCVVAAGQAFEVLAEDLTPAMLGDPA